MPGDFGHGGGSEQGFRRWLTAENTFIRAKIGPGVEPSGGNHP